MQNIDMLKEGLHEQEETLGVLSTALFSAKPAKHVKTRQTHEPQQTGTMGITCWDAGVFIYLTAYFVLYKSRGLRTKPLRTWAQFKCYLKRQNGEFKSKTSELTNQKVTGLTNSNQRTVGTMEVGTD